MTASDDIGRLAPLDDPLTRALYEFVVGSPEPVSRVAAADATGLQRPAAAARLDRLVEAGLLASESRRLTGRSGPGAGRPAKLYRRSPRDVAVSLPPRRYELLAELLLSASTHLEPDAVRSALAEESHQAGVRAGRGLETGRRPRSLLGALAGLGFEPSEAPRGVITLRNCPFHSLARRFPDEVCGFNLRFIEGLIEGLGTVGARARLSPQEGRCCVLIELPAVAA